MHEHRLAHTFVRTAGHRQLCTTICEHLRDLMDSRAGRDGRLTNWCQLQMWHALARSGSTDYCGAYDRDFAGLVESPPKFRCTNKFSQPCGLCKMADYITSFQLFSIVSAELCVRQTDLLRQHVRSIGGFLLASLGREGDLINCNIVESFGDQCAPQELLFLQKDLVAWLNALWRACKTGMGPRDTNGGAAGRRDHHVHPPSPVSPRFLPDLARKERLAAVRASNLETARLHRQQAQQARLVAQEQRTLERAARERNKTAARERQQLLGILRGMLAGEAVLDYLRTHAFFRGLREAGVLQKFPPGTKRRMSDENVEGLAREVAGFLLVSAAEPGAPGDDAEGRPPAFCPVRLMETVARLEISQSL